MRHAVYHVGVDPCHNFLFSFVRKKKCLLIDGNKKLAYDQLLLCAGAQYHTSVPTGADVDELLTTSEAMDMKRPQV